MKVLVCGKGGCGKSTVVALIAKELARRGFKVLVIDGDESNLSLHRFLGVEKPRELKELFSSRKEIFEKVKELNIRSIDDIPNEFVSEKDGIKLLCIGKIHRFGEGCACPMGALLREFLRNLQLGDGEFVVVDTEAGVEHFGRAVELGCDVVLIVLDPTYESIVLAERIKDMNLNKPIYFVLNKVDENTREIMRKNVDAIAEIPFSDDIFMRCLKGEELESTELVRDIVDYLLKLK